MNSRIKNASIYIDSGKVGKATDGTFSQKSGDEAQVGDGEVVGFSDGVMMTTLSFNTINTVDGAGPALQKAFENKADVKVKITTIDGATYTGKMRITGSDSKWENKAGSNTGSWTLEGGKLDRS